ncbi:hypothetical protein ACWT_3322 [Actinoplanes sp. SE50]|uniref:hypothetical protein n=1 Tax=unclassified Actinoplanes TaxID=2626549 RepID=UPI00023ECE91|nr:MULTISPECIES: hypothetical protein [unclassified Actinoplanes]AEV84345.1 hypothetical protein ACPL_3450 [Actinoplanes sp. SE50/110]ATO82737.1 hypothetical protein ACWT_3322 [Actinoplanes sp. SE50]SLM00144.1 hypothetical protein ACSP50_3376 [Actinoplanes sp. SE50/110]
MNVLVAELKIRARLCLNAARRGDFGLLGHLPADGGRGPSPAPGWRLRHCLTLVAKNVGFAGWDHARRVLGGDAQIGDDLGTFWHAPRCTGLLSHWFPSYSQAQVFLADTDKLVLLPYRRQFVVVDHDYLAAIGIPHAVEPGRPGRRDLVAAYGTPDWLALAQQRLHATRTPGPSSRKGGRDR